MPVVGVKRRACVNCTASKAKCTPLSESVCERCHRLEKNCTYFNVLSKRKSPNTRSHVQSLERTVDRLTAALANQSQIAQVQSEVQTPTKHALSSTSSGLLSSPQPFQAPESSQDTYHPTPLRSLSGMHTTGFEAYDVIDCGLMSVEAAQMLLDRFRSKAVVNFPYVIIPAHTTLNSIRKDAPFLFLSIIASMSSDNPPLQRRLGETIRTQIHRSILLGFENRLKLLQGLLVHLAWHYHFIVPHKQQVLLLSQLCVTLVQQLDLDKNPVNRNRTVNLELGGLRGQEHFEHTHSPAEMRALLGTYCLSSSFATAFRRRGTMPYTKYIEKCCLFLAQRNEFPTDDLILHFVRIQELSRRVHNTFSYYDLENTEIQGETITRITAESFLRELVHLRSNIPGSMQHNITLALEINFLRSLIHEAALHDEFWELPVRNESSISRNYPLTTMRINMLWDSLQSCKTFLQMFISHPNSDMGYLTYPIFTNMCYTLICLVKLVQFKSEETINADSRLIDEAATQWSTFPVWNSAIVAKESELSFFATQIQEKLKANVSVSVRKDEDPDAMTVLLLMVSNLMSGYNKRLRETQTSSASEAAGSMSDLNTTRGQMVTGLASGSSLGTSMFNTDYGGETGSSYLAQDLNFPLDMFEGTMWENMLNGFTLVPSINNS